MPDIVPSARLDVTYPAQAWGRRLYCGDSFSWNPVALFGTAGATFSGFALDPSGEHLIQAPVDLWLDTDNSQWTPQTGGYGGQPADAYSYGYATDPNPPNAAATRKILRAVPPVGNPAAYFNTLHNVVRGDDEGFRARFYRGCAPAGTATAFYVALNAPAPGAALPAGWVGYRVALVPGSPVRLQTSADNRTWTDAATAGVLGEAAAFLDAAANRLSVEVLPKTDPDWFGALPASAAAGGAPPCQIDVVINGVVLTVPAQNFLGGRLGVSGQGGQWSCLYAQRRWTVTCSAGLPAQISRAGRAIQGTPLTVVQGYLPDEDDVATLTPALTSAVSVSAALAVNAAALVDGTGYATRTVFLSAVTLDYPAVFGGAATYPDVASYGDPDLALTEISHGFSQTTGTARSRARLTFTNNTGAFSPGNVLLATRAATLWAGGKGYPFNPDDPAGEGLWPQLAGWTMLADGEGASWPWAGRQARFQLWIDGLLRRGDPRQIPCGYMAPDDGDCHYAAQRRYAYKIGVSDDRCNFPHVLRGDSTPYYYLPRGTTRDPVLLPHPSTPVGQQMELIRRLSGEYDPAGSGQVLPMILREGIDSTGFSTLDYFPMPAGLVQWFLDPSLTLDDLGITPAMVLSATPVVAGGVAALNELTNDGYRTGASLSHIRTPVVYEGIDPALGAAVVGVAYNELLGDGPYADPDQPGNVGLDVPLYDISRYVTSQAQAQFLAALASVQLAVPAISAVFPLVFQPQLRPLTVVANYEPISQGTTAVVPYWTGDVASTIDYLADPGYPRAATLAAGRLLGQPGD